MAVTLRASKQGRDIVDQARRKKGWAAKATSWCSAANTSPATLKRFREGSRINQDAFVAICKAVGVENWEEIVDDDIPLPQTVPIPKFCAYDDDALTGQEHSLLKNVEYNAKVTREQLKTYTLERIRRSKLLDEFLKKIELGITKDKGIVIPIIGSAGYGKSTILGNIYDELYYKLVNPRKSWISLVRCDDFIGKDLVNTFAVQLSERVSGVANLSIDEITLELNNKYGKGVLLIDTLDSLLNNDLATIFRSILFKIIKTGTTVVFTCRQEDFELFFDPYHESFAGFYDNVFMEYVPLFEEDEVKKAVELFLKEKQNIEEINIINECVNQIIELQASEQSLNEIIRSPLLLAMLCELFFIKQEQIPPEDLTVSHLYEKYWDWKISQPRKSHHRQEKRIKEVMKKLCFKIANLMYTKSLYDGTLHKYVYEDQLELESSESFNTEAYEELKSNRVLQVNQNEGKVTFFHQTFIEYIICRWLVSTSEGSKEKKKLLENIQLQSSYFKPYLYPIIRQILTIDNIDEFKNICHCLDKKELLSFKAIAPASVSRKEPEASSILSDQLLPISLDQGKLYQEELLKAARSALKFHAETVWSVVVELIQKSEPGLVNKVGSTSGELLGRLNTSTDLRIKQALQAVQNRHSLNCQEQQRHLLGQLISEYSKTLKIFKRNVDLTALDTFKDYYFILIGSGSRGKLIDLYLDPGVPLEVQREFLMQIIKKRTSEEFKEAQKATELLKHLLPSLLESGNTIFGNCWIEALHAPLPKRWHEIQQIVVGYQVANDYKLIVKLLQQVFKEHLENGEEKRISRNKAAIVEAIRLGAGNSVASALLEIPIDTIPRNRINLLKDLIENLATKINSSCSINQQLRERLARYIWSLHEKRYPIQLILPLLPAIATLADSCQELRESVDKFIEEILKNSEIIQSDKNQVIKGLNNLPESYLKTNIDIRESKLVMIKFYQSQAENEKSEQALLELQNLCINVSDTVARKASKAILEIAKKKLQMNVVDFIPIFSKSTNTEVRANCLKAIIAIISSGYRVTEQEVITFFKILERDSTPEVVQPLYKLVQQFVETNSCISCELATETFSLTYKLINERTTENINGGIASSIFRALKNIANNIQNKEIILQLGECTRAILRATNVEGVHNKVVIGLLDKVARIYNSEYNFKFFSQIYKEDFFRENKQPLIKIVNMKVVITAIVFQGKSSSLLDDMLNDDRLPQEVKEHIRTERKD